MIAISARRDVVSLYLEGDEVHPPGHPDRAQQGEPGSRDAREVPGPPRLGREAAHRARVRRRRDALHDVLTVLQRAELLLRTSYEVERYIIELGAEGRLIEMQLEETVVGVAPRPRGPDPRLRGRRLREQPSTTPSRPSRACRTRSFSTSVGWPSCSATTARPTRTTSRSPPRGYRVLGRIPRLPRLVGEKVVQELGSLEAILAASEAELTGIDGVGEARAADIREGLDRLREIDAFDRYPQM